MKMKKRYIIAALAVLVILSGCGVYRRSYESFESQHSLPLPDDPVRAYCTITPRHVQKRILLIYWSDVYSPPYRFDFVVQSDTRPEQPAQLHALTLRLPGGNLVLHSKEDPPVAMRLQKKRYYDNFEATHSFPLQDKLEFQEDRKFKASVTWSFPGDARPRMLETDFVGRKESSRCSIWTVIQGI